MRRLLKFSLPILLLGGSLVVFLWLEASQVPDQPIEAIEKTWTVTTVRAQRQSLSPTVRLYGRIESPHESHRRAAISADVQQVPVLVGTTVAPGDLLVRLDDRSLQLLLRQREGDLLEIKAQIDSEKRRYAADLEALQIERTLLQLGEKALDRAEQLARTQAGSAARVDEAQHAQHAQTLAIANRRRAINDHNPRLAQLRARQQRAEALHDQARNDLERTAVRALAPGKVTAVHVSPGDRVRAGDQLVDVFDTRLIEVRAQIPNRHLPTLRHGLSAGTTIAATANIEGRVRSLRLDRLAGKIEPGQGGVDAFFSFRGHAIPVELGRTIALTIELPAKAQVIPLPATAIYGANTVYRVINNRLDRVAVQRVGEYNNGDQGSWVLVTGDAIKEGDAVLSHQLPGAVDGLKVASAPTGN